MKGLDSAFQGIGNKEYAWIRFDFWWYIALLYAHYLIIADSSKIHRGIEIWSIDKSQNVTILKSSASSEFQSGTFASKLIIKAPWSASISSHSNVCFYECVKTFI